MRQANWLLHMCQFGQGFQGGLNLQLNQNMTISNQPKNLQKIPVSLMKEQWLSPFDLV